MKTLKEFDFGTRSVGSTTYDWDAILDGEIHVMEAGKDFECKPATLTSRARAMAKKQGLRVRTGKTDDGDVVIQAIPLDDDDAFEKAKASKAAKDETPTTTRRRKKTS